MGIPVCAVSLLTSLTLVRGVLEHGAAAHGCRPRIFVNDDTLVLEVHAVAAGGGADAIPLPACGTAARGVAVREVVHVELGGRRPARAARRARCPT